jgi:hypothetical protein
METLYRMFPPDEKPSTGNYILDHLIEQSWGPEYKDTLDKWIDYLTPLIIEEGIKKGAWFA